MYLDLEPTYCVKFIPSEAVLVTSLKKFILINSNSTPDKVGSGSIYVGNVENIHSRRNTAGTDPAG
jgi:hypothetical protein